MPNRAARLWPSSPPWDSVLCVVFLLSLSRQGLPEGAAKTLCRVLDGMAPLINGRQAACWSLCLVSPAFPQNKTQFLQALYWTRILEHNAEVTLYLSDSILCTIRGTYSFWRPRFGKALKHVHYFEHLSSSICLKLCTFLGALFPALCISWCVLCSDLLWCRDKDMSLNQNSRPELSWTLHPGLPLI